MRVSAVRLSGEYKDTFLLLLQSCRAAGPRRKDVMSCDNNFIIVVAREEGRLTRTLAQTGMLTAGPFC
jgi:hypothetical protein